jgi:hypothetical protein
MPNARHFPHKMTANSYTDKQNTMIAPWVDVQADIDAINRGEAIVDRSNATAWTNGRLYGYHTDQGPEGTAYPRSGHGFTPFNGAQHRVLRYAIQEGGLTDNVERRLCNEKRLSDDERDSVREQWRVRIRTLEGRK